MGLNIAGGWFPLVLLVFGGLAMVALLLGRGRDWWLNRVPLVLVAATLLTTGFTWFTNHVWKPFADALPPSVVWALAAALVALGLAITHPGKWKRRTVASIGVVLVVLAGAVQVNVEFGEYPTLGALLGEPLPGEVDSSSIIGQSGSVIASTTGDAPVADDWKEPSGLPTAGVLTSVQIPGTISKFPAGTAWVYLPPAYQANPRPLLPVLILLAGQPGDARNWFDGGQAAQTMDAYAAAHQGLAPVVISPDWVGNTNGNPMCVDSTVGGNDYTYLTQDLPNWIKANLEVDTRPTRWAVGGLSAGATCSLQLATNDPAQFPTFLVFSGQTEPTLSNRADTVTALFNGDESAFTKINPLDIMKAQQFPDSAGVFVVGDSDAEYGPQTKQVYEAAKAAGMDVQFRTEPGGHEFAVWSAALSSSMDWLGTRLKLTD